MADRGCSHRASARVGHRRFGWAQGVVAEVTRELRVGELAVRFCASCGNVKMPAFM